MRDPPGVAVNDGLSAVDSIAGKIDDRTIAGSRQENQKEKQPQTDSICFPHFFGHRYHIPAPETRGRPLRKGFRVLRSEFKVPVLKFWKKRGRRQEAGGGIQDSGFRIQDSGFRIQESGFRSQEAAWFQSHNLNSERITN
jgi:hypothetical protein